MFLGEKREKKTRKKCTWVKKKGGCRTVFVGFRSVWGAENTYFSSGACGGLLDEELNSRSSVGEGWYQSVFYPVWDRTVFEFWALKVSKYTVFLTESFDFQLSLNFGLLGLQEKHTLWGTAQNYIIISLYQCFFFSFQKTKIFSSRKIFAPFGRDFSQIWLILEQF